ncbi:NAD(P)H-dependent oxidoreductase [Helicobacter fennelliae]|uniref:Modulator of drug activity B n=1 Tax=Helicobacter fennelliae MRY12-0050 TaxID=1325130 RepID=T1DV75_9HELI|nr:NAD(P)H-dependent oxidoreductase [Helicobacter fennelliae]GAD18493.1 modulator of drug activity B [Helicobacter fennelliae MRY12-0050]STP08141.1 putative drug activity modulator protein [Helicobacter fennelliae]STQ83951.1 putative drug activity modulator protein [Helicobacter fennelliae]
MQKILILNGGMSYGESGGKLNLAFSEIIAQELEKLGKSVQTTYIAQGYEIKAEVAKWKDTDAVIWQMPGWWMGEPWIVKKYIDEVLYAEALGVLFSGDGRSRSDESKRYGSGGLCQGKAMMLSTTWNAPLYAFNEVGELFDGRGVDEVFAHFYKIHKFIGFSKFLPSFMANDVHKKPDFTKWEADLRAHVRGNFS